MFIVKNMRAFGEEIPILSCKWHIFSVRKDENLFLEKFWGLIPFVTPNKPAKNKVAVHLHLLDEYVSFCGISNMHKRKIT